MRSFHQQACRSVGLPVPLDSAAITTFRSLLKDHLDLCRKRAELERQAEAILSDNADYQILRSIPGIGPIIALTTLAEGGDLRRFGCEKLFLKYCGLDLSTQQQDFYLLRRTAPKRPI